MRAVSTGESGAPGYHKPPCQIKEEGGLDETGLMAEPYFETGIRIGNVLVTEEGIGVCSLPRRRLLPESKF